jgi:hypothetical protein
MPPTQLANLSTRGFVDSDAKLLIAGLVIAGDSPPRILICAARPALAAFGVTDALTVPQLSLFAAGTEDPLATNNDWGTATGVALVEVYTLPSE